MPKLETTYFNNIAQIPDLVFEQIGCTQTFYFEKGFLSAFAKANPSIEHRYLIIHNDSNPVALAIMQRLSVDLENASEKLSLQHKIAKSLQCYLSNRSVQVSVCGNVFLSGNYGVFIKDGYNTSNIFAHIAQEMKPLRTKKRASVFFFKDFVATEIKDVRTLEAFQFQPFSVEPNMRLKITWNDFESYKASLRSKYRVKVNKADSQSASLIMKSFNAEDIRNHSEILQQLYCNITDRAMFKTVDMQMETYALLKEHNPEKVMFNAYYQDTTIVGFATSFIHQETIDAHYIGIDYKVNKELSIYPRILNDYVRMGIDLGCSEVNLGRTSSEIKSTLGAIPDNLTCYVRHRRTIANLLFKPLVRQIKMTEYKQHRPFKKV